MLARVNWLKSSRADKIKKSGKELRILMKDFAGKIAVITGGGTGMGRELARQLVAEGCNVAMCDVSIEAMAETKATRKTRWSLCRAAYSSEAVMSPASNSGKSAR